MSAEEACCLSANHFPALRTGNCHTNTSVAGSVCGSSQNQYITLTLGCVYRHPDRGQVAGVLEVIQTSEDMVFSDLVEILSQVIASLVL